MLLHVRGNGLYFQTGRNRKAQTHAGTMCSEEDVTKFKGEQKFTFLKKKKEKKLAPNMLILYHLIIRPRSCFVFFPPISNIWTLTSTFCMFPSKTRLQNTSKRETRRPTCFLEQISDTKKNSSSVTQTTA